MHSLPGRLARLTAGLVDALAILAVSNPATVEL